MAALHPLLFALQEALVSGNVVDLQHASDLATDEVLRDIQEMLLPPSDGTSAIWQAFERYDVVTDALLVVRLLLRVPSSVLELLESPEAQGLLLDLENFHTAPIGLQNSLGDFLHASGQRQTNRWQQRLAFGLDG